MEKIDIRDSFPVLDGGDGLILSKRGDVALGWELSLPPVLRTSEQSYDALVTALRSALSLLPDYTIVHKMDFFFSSLFHWDDNMCVPESGDALSPGGGEDAPSSEGKPGFLEKSFREHFEGRRYMDHRCYLFLTFCSKATLHPGGSGLRGCGRRAVMPSEEVLSSRLGAASRFEAVLRGCDLLSLRRLTGEDIFGSDGRPGILQSYLNFSADGTDTLSDISLSPSRVLIGEDRAVCCHMISDLGSLPTEVSSVRKVEGLCTEHSSVVESFLGECGVTLDCDHIVNAVIVKDRASEVEASLSRKGRRMLSMSSRSTPNRMYAQEIASYLEDVASGGMLTVGCHLSILSCGSPSSIDSVKDKVVTSVTRMGLTPVQDCYDTPSVFWGCIPGNEPGLGRDAVMTMEATSALCLGLYDGQERGLKDGNLVLCDRQRSLPVRFDIGEKALGEGLIENFNVFLLGPSGSGKSFFMNRYLLSCYNSGAHCFLIDVGDSYRALSGIIREESQGRDGTYYTFEKGSPLSFNPFRNVSRFRENADGRALEFLYTLMCTLWKGNGSLEGGGPSPGVNAMEESFVKESVNLFLGSWKSPEDPLFNDYYDFLQVAYPAILQERDIDPRYFDLKGYLLSLGQFYRGGAYDYLLNSPRSVDILSDRFVVFEIDSIKDDRVIYPITTLVIMDAFMEKMTSVPSFKVMCIEEAWKAVMGRGMATYMMELWKTARKHRTSAVVVTQELSDITSSSIIKDTIVENSAVKILLDQSKFISRFDELGSALALDGGDKALVLSLNRYPSPYGGRDAFFSLGNRRSFVWRVEVSPEEMVAFSSGKKDRERLQGMLRSCGGSYRKAIERILHPWDGTGERMKEGEAAFSVEQTEPTDN